jgi:ParB family chromosome partitioning protein
VIKNLMMIPIEQISGGEYEVRAKDEDENFKELLISIKENGILQPIICIPDLDGFKVLAGHRRLRAAKILEIEKVPVAVVDDKGQDSWSVALDENLCRLDMSPMEIAAAAADMIEYGVKTKEEVAKIFRKTTSWVGERIMMLEWPGEIQQAVHHKKIAVSAAKNLALIEDELQRQTLLDFAVESGATARTTAAWLQAYRAGASLREPEKIEPTPGRPGQQTIEPHTPCVICDKMMRMIELSYLPICGDCQDLVLKAIRQQRQQQSG